MFTFTPQPLVINLFFIEESSTAVFVSQGSDVLEAPVDVDTNGSSVSSCRTVCGFRVSDRTDKIFLLLRLFLRLVFTCVCACVCLFSFPGLSELIHDNLTESKRTINLLQRMNIYQEVFLSVLYRLLPIQVNHHLIYNRPNQISMTRHLNHWSVISNFLN